MTSPATEADVHYTIFVRLPFPRGDFIDPPASNWNAIKDRALWEILSKPSKGNDIDWKAIADELNVTLPFLLQQAAWLYDRQLSQVRAQMLKVGNTHSQSPSPSPGPESASTSGALGGEAMRRMGSGGQFAGIQAKRIERDLIPSPGSRVPSRLSTMQREGQISRQESSSSVATRAKGPFGRTNSTTTITQGRPANEGTDRPLATTAPLSSTDRAATRSDRPSLAILQKHRPTSEATHENLSSSDDPDRDSDSDSDLHNDDDDDDEYETNVAASRRLPGIRRFGKSSIRKPSLRDNLDEDDDPDESPAFLPLNRGPQTGTQQMTSTLRQQNNAPETSKRQMTGYVPSHRCELASLDSSASSGVAVGSPRPGPQPLTDLPSPQRVAHLSRQSSRQPGSANQSSEETPSMGSSFSDLDDASVTQSALEEALLSNMQHGGVTSRMSTISQALRSRYL